MSSEKNTEKSTENGTAATSGPAPAPPAQAPFPFSKSITHLKSFPIISDSISGIQAHPVGQRSISISTTAYDRFVKPFSPYIIKANEFASPIVSKADDFADHGIGLVEQKFPILKEPTENVRGKLSEKVGHSKQFAVGLYGQGWEFACDRKDHVTRIYNDEYTREANRGYLPAAKAGITTSFVVAAESLQWAADQMGKKSPPPTTDSANGSTEKPSGAANGTTNGTAN